VLRWIESQLWWRVLQSEVSCQIPTLINGKGVRVSKIFDEIPEWATDDLIERYNKQQDN